MLNRETIVMGVAHLLASLALGAKEILTHKSENLKCLNDQLKTSVEGELENIRQHIENSALEDLYQKLKEETISGLKSKQPQYARNTMQQGGVRRGEFSTTIDELERALKDLKRIQQDFHNAIMGSSRNSFSA